MQRTTKLLVLLLGSVLLAAAAFASLAGSGTAAQQAPPRNQAPPTLSDTPEEGQTLTADPGRWSGPAPTFVYRYQRCDANGGQCFTGGSTTQRTYVLTQADVGKTIRVRVTARNADGQTVATSVPTAMVREAQGTPAPPTRGCLGNAPLQVAGIAAPDRLVVDQQQASPSVVGRSTETLTLRFHVSCRGKAVQGALVYATAVPFSQFSIPAEQPTGADGWAQLTLNQGRFFPAATRQQLLVVFVRARKAGEDLLGGISTRRLVSFPVNLSR